MVEEKKKTFVDPQTGEEISIGFDNPASHIREMKASGTLGLVLAKENNIFAYFLNLLCNILH